MCRDSASAPGARMFDRPLSTRFDEQDAFVIFDDVEIPRERLFIDGQHRPLQRASAAPACVDNLTNQTTIRALTKLEFAYGLATRMAEAIGDASPATQEMLGELLDYVEVTRSAVCSPPSTGETWATACGSPTAAPLAPDAVAPRHVVPARERDHHAHRQPQPAGHAEPTPARRRRRSAR